jgi:endonuclease/exonuclease/phosphatase family metal-dependent hydrolase
MTARWWIAIAVAALAARVACSDDREPPRLRIATFNIEDFPKDDRQIAGAFDEIARLDAGIVALQEIVDPAVFARAAHTRLGADWEFIYASTAPERPAHPVHHLGVLFDRSRWTLVSSRLHDDTRLAEGRHKPTFEVRLQPASGSILRVLVVHLKAGGDHEATRARQLAALAAVLRTALESGERVVLLGDFNATGAGDRDAIATLAATTSLHWSTEALACSAFWNRDDGCPRSRLDHVLAWSAAARVEAAGACATEGCDWQDRCPIYREHVSDHCPVVVDF